MSKPRFISLLFVLFAVLVIAATCDGRQTSRLHSVGEFTGAAWMESADNFHPGTTQADVYKVVGQAKLGIPGECGNETPTGTLVVAMTSLDNGSSVLVETGSYSDQAQQYCTILKGNLTPATKEELAAFVATGFPTTRHDIGNAIANAYPAIEDIAGKTLVPALVIGSYFVGFAGGKTATGATRAGEMALFDSVRASKFTAGASETAIKNAFREGKWLTTADDLAKSARLGEEARLELRSANSAEQALALASKMKLPEKLTESGGRMGVELVVGKNTFALAHPTIGPGDRAFFQLSRPGYKVTKGFWPILVAEEVPALDIVWSVERANPAIEQMLASIKADSRLLPAMRQDLTQSLRVQQETLAMTGKVLEEVKAAKGAIMAQIEELGVAVHEQTEVTQQILQRTKNLSTTADVEKAIARALEERGVRATEAEIGSLAAQATKINRASNGLADWTLESMGAALRGSGNGFYEVPLSPATYVGTTSVPAPILMGGN